MKKNNLKLITLCVLSLLSATGCGETVMPSSTPPLSFEVPPIEYPIEEEIAQGVTANDEKYAVKNVVQRENSPLKGKTIYLTGKGTTPDYTLQYILAQNGLTDECTLEYKSEATEVAAVLAENPQAVGLLPQPFVTAACAQNEALSVIFDMDEQWNKAQSENGSSTVTGVTVVRNEFLKENEDAVMIFLTEHKESAEAINADPAKGATLAVEAGIIAKEPIAQKAIPNCNIVCITGEEVQKKLEAYLTVLYEQSPEAVGGKLPAQEFYY